MPSQLTAEVSVATAEAYRNLNQVAQMIGVTQSSMEKLGDVVAVQENKIRSLAAQLQDAEEQFKATGAEADRMKMEELRAALDKTTSGATRMHNEYQRVAMTLGELSGTSRRVSPYLVADNKRVADSATEVEEKTEKAGRAGKKAGEDHAKGSKSAKDETIGLGQAISSLGIGTAIFAALKKGIEEYEERIRRAQEATKEMGAKRLDFDRSVKDVIDNLGLIPDKAGQARAGALVSGLQKMAPGIAPDVAATILAKGQATGFDIADAKHPEKDMKTTGFAIAGEVAKFAMRTNLDPDTAGKLFNMAQLAGVKNKGDMEKMLAKMEGAFQNIAITDPREGMQTAIRASAGRMMQGVPIEQAMAAVAAAAIGEPEARVAATNVEQFTRVAVGTDDTRKLRLAQLAQKFGLIDEKSLAKARVEVAPTIKKDNALEIERANMSIKGKEEGITRREREEADYLSDTAESLRKYVAELAETDKEIADPRKRKQRPHLEERRKEIVYEIQKMNRERSERLATDQKETTRDKEEIALIQKSIEKEGKEDKRKLEEAALRQVYAGLPLAEREKLLYRATQGMTQQQLGQFAGQVAEGDIAQQLVKQLSPAAREAYNAALKSASTSQVREFRRRNAAYGLSDISEADAAKQSADQSLREGTPAGQDFLNNVDVITTADISILRGRGEGQTGAMAAAAIGVGQLDVFNNAGSDQVLRAKRKMIVARNIFARWHASLDPRMRKIYDNEINGIWQIFWQRWKYVFSNRSLSPTIAADKAAMADTAVRDIGAFMQRIQKIAQEKGFNPGNASPDISAPALRNSPVYKDPEMSGGGGAQGENAMDLTGASAEPAGRANDVLNSVPEAGGGMSLPAGGVASAGRGLTQYNVSVGMIVTQNAESMDLPAMLGAADIG